MDDLLSFILRLRSLFRHLGKVGQQLWGHRFIRRSLCFLAALGCTVLSPTVFAQTSAQTTTLNPQQPLPSSFSGQSTITDASSLIQQSRQRYEAGQLGQSIELLQQAIVSYQAQGDNLNSALALRNLALVYQDLGQWPEATHAISTSLEQLSSVTTNDRLPVLARTLDMQGHLYLNQGQTESALEVWQSAAEIYTTLDDQSRWLRNQISQAQALQSMGMYRRAIATLTDLTQILAQQPDSETKAIGFQLLGNSLQVAGNLGLAETNLKASLSVAERLGLNEIISSTKVALGNTARSKGDFSAALQFYRQAANQTQVLLTQTQAQLSELAVLIDTQQWAQADPLASQLQQQVQGLPLSQASVYAKINLSDNRLKLAKRQVSPTAAASRGITSDRSATSSRIPTAPPSAPLTAYTRDNIDLVDVFIGRNAPELRAPTVGSARPASPSVTESTYTRDNLNLVETFLSGRSATPGRTASPPANTPQTAPQSSNPDARPSPTPFPGGNTYTRDNLDLTEYFLQGNAQPGPEPNQATFSGDTYTRDNLDLTEYFLQGSSESTQAPQSRGASNRPTRSSANANVTPTASLSNATLTEIAQLLQQAQQDAQTLGDPRSESYAIGSLGRVYEEATQWSDAKSLTEKALLISQTINAPEISYRWQWQLGRILKADSKLKNRQNPDYAKAINAYSESVNTLQTLRDDLVAINPEIQVAFQESVEPIHRELVGILLPENKAATPDKLEKARNVIESLQLAELDNFFREACLDANPVAIDQVDRQAAIFYPIILPDRLEVIVRLPGQSLRHFSTPVAQAKVETTITQLRQALTQKTSQRYLPLSQQVYDWLIRPIASDLTNTGIETLVFVSDGVLRNVPMVVLHDGQQFIMEQYAVALTPGLQLLEPNPITRKNLSVVTAGLSEARQGFPSLPNVSTEIEEIQNNLPSQKTLLNQEFTEESFAEAIRNLDAPIVHLATHGKFSSNFEDTFVLTWDDQLSVHQLRDLLQGTGINNSSSGVVELLVLSACETAIGDRQAALGLAGTAVRSGARSTVGSLWQVSDEATATLISRFYEELATGEVTKAEALRRAQQSILEIPRFRGHPFFWAPYIMVGNWL